MEFVTYSAESGFNIVDVDDEQSAEMMTGPESVCLDPVDEFDDVIVRRIRELLVDEKPKMIIQDLLDAYPNLLLYDYKWKDSENYRDLADVLSIIGYRLVYDEDNDAIPHWEVKEPEWA